MRDAFSRECPELCVSGPADAGFRYGQMVKQSSTIIANWLRFVFSLPLRATPLLRLHSCCP